MSRDETKIGLMWSKEDAEKAAHKHSFIRVTYSDKRSYRHLTGAERTWQNPDTANEVFLINYRITGTPEDIETAMANAGYSPDQIKDAMAGAVTSKNYKKGKKSIYESELERWKNFKQEEKERKERETVDWATLLLIASRVKDAHIIMKEKTSPAKKGRGKTFLERYKEIKGQENKMVDVTEMREDGTKVVPRGTPSSNRGKKVFIPGIPIMSESQKNYMRALEMLYNINEIESDAEYQKIVRAAELKFASKKKS